MDVVSLALALLLASPTPEPAAYAVLDTVGALSSATYDPRPVINTINILQPMGRKAGTALLRSYLKNRGHRTQVQTALFAVLRVIYTPPAAKPPFPKDACTPRQRLFVSGSCFRPPRLGSPVPSPPENLRSLRFPFFVLGDVPLSLVAGYDLGGVAEPLSMHLEALATSKSTWLAAPLKPKSAGEVRYLFMHYGQWPWNSPVGQAVDKQLNLLQ